MEGDAHVRAGEVEVQLPNEADAEVERDREIAINGVSNLSNEGRKEDDGKEMVSDGDFIKIEKELIDVKDRTHSVKAAAEVEEIPSTKNIDSGNLTANVDLSHVGGKIEELEHQLASVTRELQISESERAKLKSEIVIANEKLEKMDKHQEELESDRVRLNKELLDAEQKYHKQLESLQDALGSLDVNHKELVDVKEAFSALSAELECSRKKLEELETQLVSSADEARKYEELSNERGSHAERESKKALELEKMLQVAELHSKEMESQMGNLQEELKRLYDKIVENQKVEEALSSTAAELSTVQEKLEISRSLTMDLEQKLASGEVIVHDLTKELNLRKASEEQMREDMLALEKLLSAFKEDIQAKLAKVEELELKLHDEVKTREITEGSLKNQEIQVSGLQEELAKLAGEKEAVDNIVADLNISLSLKMEKCSELEEHLKLANINLDKTGSLLSQASVNNKDLEQKLKSLEELLEESKNVAEAATRKNLELDSLIRASNVNEEAVKAQLRETEMRLVSAEKRSNELEQQATITEQRFTDAKWEIKELTEKITELTTSLKGAEEESVLSRSHFLAYEDTVDQLESSVSHYSSRNSELEQELKVMAEKCAEHEGRANERHQRSLELEDLVHASRSKAEDAGKRVSELELLLETTAKDRSQELEVLLSNMEQKHQDAEAESKQHRDRVSEISAELEVFRAKSARLEMLLQAATEKEKELADALNAIADEKNKFEELSTISTEKLLHAEKLVDTLKTELNCAQEKLASAEKALQFSSVREQEILERLKSAEEQLEHQQRAVQLASARSLELETLHESSVKDSEIKLKEALASISDKDFEAKQLYEKLKSLDEQLSFYQDQAIEATEKVASLKAELQANAVKFVSLEQIVDDLQIKLKETEVTAEQSTSENELLVGTNSKLREELESHQHKVNDLHELINTILAEKEATAEQLASHVKTLAELTDEHTRGLEIQSTTESRMKETEFQLQDAIHKFNQKDSETKDLSEKLLAFEDQVRVYEVQVRETSATMESQKIELEEARAKLQSLEGCIDEMQNKTSQLESNNEGLIRTNLSLSEELATYEEKLNELKTTLNAFSAEKEHTSGQLDSSNKTIEDLMQQIASEGEKHESQISSIMVENNMLNEMYQGAKKELQEVIAQLEEKMNDHRASETTLSVELENLKRELTEKSMLQAQTSELEQQLLLAEMKFKEEIQSIQSGADKREKDLSSKLEEHKTMLQDKHVLDEMLQDLQNKLDQAQSTMATKDAEAAEKLALVNVELEDLKHKLHQSTELERTVMELENKLQLATTKPREEVMDEIRETHIKDELDVKSRDLDFSTSTPMKRKNKKKSERARNEMASAQPMNSSATVHSGAMAFKFVMGVALVSMIIGIILGKRY